MPMVRQGHWIRIALGLSIALLSLLCPFSSKAQGEDQSPASAPSAAAEPQPIPFEQETLDNGLRVIYAPLHQAPVVHVRVLYHVGSRDERPDRQGFAHMFEHMMFRGSAHVAPQEHMRRIDDVGGMSNAFTSFDETVYVNTVPSQDLRMALYLEADRMSSFKVSEDIYKTERRVVAEEWRILQNKPYGNLFQDFLKTAFTTHSYRWTPIGNMQHLLAAPVSELQDFFNTYYVPNNAVLVIAGDIDIAQAKQMVHQYYAWIPRGPEIHRLAIPEPPQTAPRSATVPDRLAPLTEILLGYHIPPYRSDDQYPLRLLSAILGEGNSSRLDRLLVDNDHPLCHDASTVYEPLEDGGIFGVAGRMLSGKNPDEVIAALKSAIADVVDHGVSDEELAKAKTEARIAILNGRQTAEEIASQLGDEALFADDASRVNSDLNKLDAVTSSDIARIAVSYLKPEQSTLLVVTPDPLGTKSRRAAAVITPESPVAPSTQPVKPREVHFPADYPDRAPAAEPPTKVIFAKGVESQVNGVKVIVMQDSRLPLVQWNLVLRRGSHSDPIGKEGLAGMTAEMLRHGAGSLSYAQLAEELESHGITLGVSDGGDVTRLSGSASTDEVDRGFARTRDLLLHPTFPEDEFNRVKEQTINGLAVDEDSAATVAAWDLSASLFGDSPLGRRPSMTSLSSITLDDVKQFYKSIYHPNDAMLIISGDVTPERGEALAQKLTDGWPFVDHLPEVSYDFPPISTSRQIILVDRPGGRGSAIRIAHRAYDIHAPEKFAGALAGAVLSGGIESRLMVYVRAERGLVYGVRGMFLPDRHSGQFQISTDTKLETTADTINAIYKVLNDARTTDITSDELARAKTRVAGQLVMSTQTIAQQATLRSEGVLDDYPLDYFDSYPQRIASVTADDIRSVLKQYVDPNQMTIVVVAPAAEVKSQLDALGSVKVLPMPAEREKFGGNGGELLKENGAKTTK